MQPLRPSEAAHSSTNPPRRRISALFALLLGAFAATAHAQPADLQRIERLLGADAGAFQPSPAPGSELAELLFIESSLTTTIAGLTVENDDGQTTDVFQASLRPALRMSYLDAHELVAAFDIDFRVYGEGDDTSPSARSGQLARPFIERLYYRFDAGAARQLSERLSQRRQPNQTRATPRELFGQAPSTQPPPPPSDNLGFALTLGKLPMTIGTGLVLDQTLVGGTATIRRNTLRATALAGYTPPRSTIDVDPSRPGFDSQTERLFFGVELAADRGDVRPFAYLLTQIDNNDEDTALVPIGPVQVPVQFGYDSHYAGLGFEASTSEQTVITAETVYQWGRSTSRPLDPNTGALLNPQLENISAWAALARATHFLNDDADTRLEAAIAAGSGDPDRISSNQTLGGNKAGTIDRAFNAFGFARTGEVLAPELSNLAVIRTGASTNLAGNDNLRAAIDLFAYIKLDPDAGNSFNTQSGERFAGTAIDASLAWRLAADLTLDLQYGVFIPGDAIPNDNDGLRHLLFAGLTHAW